MEEGGIVLIEKKAAQVATIGALFPGAPLAGAIERFFAEGNFTGATRGNYLRCLRQFGIWLRHHGLRLEDLRARDIDRFLQELTAGPSRRRGLLSFLKSFLGSLEVQGLLDRNAAGSIRPTKNPYRLGGVTPALSDDDLERLRSHVRGKAAAGGVIEWRDHALLEVLLESFGRIGAVYDLRLSDYQQAGTRRFLRFEEKGRKIQMKEIPRRLARILDEYLLQAGLEPGGPGPLFRSARGRGKTLSLLPLSDRGARHLLQRLGEETGLPGLHPHMLRVTGYNKFRRAGRDLEAGRIRMGHDSQLMSLSYEREDPHAAALQFSSWLLPGPAGDPFSIQSAVVVFSGSPATVQAALPGPAELSLRLGSGGEPEP